MSDAPHRAKCQYPLVNLEDHMTQSRDYALWVDNMGVGISSNGISLLCHMNIRQWTPRSPNPLQLVILCYGPYTFFDDSIHYPEVSSLKDAIQSECVTRWVSGGARL